MRESRRRDHGILEPTNGEIGHLAQAIADAVDVLLQPVLKVRDHRRCRPPPSRRDLHVSKPYTRREARSSSTPLTIDGLQRKR